MKKGIKKNIKIIGISVFVILIILILALAFSYSGKPASITYQGKEVEVLLPVYGSYKCEMSDRLRVPDYQLPKSGFWIDRQIAYTDAITNIKVYVSKGFWSAFVDLIVGFETRILYKICDAKRSNCFEYTDNVNTWGDVYLDSLPPSISTESKSIFIQLQGKIPFGSWEGKDPKDSRIYLSYYPYGLFIYDENIGFGEPICETSCSIKCPDIAERGEGFIEGCDTNDAECNEIPAGDIVGFNRAVSYLKYFRKEPALIGDQYGGTFWVENDEKFCFGGYIYDVAEMTLDDGKIYIYPGKYTGDKKECCPGALISLGMSNKLCNDNYEWVDLGGSPFPCISDMQCPGKGQGVCQKKLTDNYVFTQWGCVSGFCKSGTETQVECCPPSLGCLEDEVCQNNECVGGGPVPPVEDCTKDSDCIKIAGGKCVSGKCRYPDQETCKGCDDFAISTILGSIFKSKKCTPTQFSLPPQTFFWCWFAFLKLILIPVTLIFTFLFSVEWLERFKALKGEKKKIWRIILSIIFGILLAFFVYISFWIGIIIFILYIIMRVLISIFL